MELRHQPILWASKFLMGFLFVVAALSSSAATPPTSKKWLGYGYKPSHYAIAIVPKIEEKRISGSVTCTFKPEIVLATYVFKLEESFIVDEVLFEGKPLKVRNYGAYRSASLPRSIMPNTTHQVTVRYHGKPRKAVRAPWDGGFVWGKDSLNRPWVGTAVQGIGASTWWPCADTISFKPDSISIACTVPHGLVFKGNGLLRIIDVTQESATFHYAVTHPINLYNVSLNIGCYTSEELELPSVGGLPPRKIWLHFLDYHANRAKNHFLQHLPVVLSSLEQAYGEYPFWRDGLAFVETPYWGMEHQSAIAYGNNFELNRISSRDQIVQPPGVENDFAPKGPPQLVNFDFIMAHELAHEWWGNSVSTSAEEDFWINEGFATFSEYIVIAGIAFYQTHPLTDRLPPLTFDRELVSQVLMPYALNQRAKIVYRKPLVADRGIEGDKASKVNPKEPPDNDPYYRGAWTLIWLGEIIGYEELMLALREIQDKHAHAFITTAQVEAIFQSHSKTPMDTFFKTYLH